MGKLQTRPVVVTPSGGVMTPREHEGSAIRTWLRACARPLVVSLVIAVALFAPVATSELAPDVGVETRYVNDSWVISSVTRGGLADQAGLRPGDTVDALDGVSPHTRRLTSPSLDVTGVRSWRVARGGEQFVVVMDAGAAPLTTRLEPAVMLGLALVFWASGVAVRLFKPFDLLAYHYWRLAATVALVIALAPAAAHDSWWAKPLEVLAFSLVPAFFYEFCAAFAPGTRTRGSRPAQILLCGGVLVGISYLVAGYLGAWWYDGSRGVLLFLLAGGSIAGVGHLVRAYHRPPTARARHQIQIVFLGAAAGALPLTVLSAAPEALGAQSIVRPQLAALALIALPLAVAYSIVRHRLLDIDVVLSRTLVYGVMSLLLAGCYALLLVLLNLLTLEHTQTVPPALAVLFFAVVSASFIPVHNWLRRVTDYLIYRDRYDHVYFLRELAARFASVAPIDEVLPSITRSLTQAMNLKGAAVLLQQADGSLAIRAASGVCVEPAYAQELVSRAMARRDGGDRGTAEGGHWLPLEAHGGEAGLLFLGTKRTRVPFGAEDLSVAQTIASNAAISVANALLVDRLRAKVAELELLRDQLLHAEEAERKRIAQELHDGALHSLLALVRQAEGVADGVSADHASGPHLSAQIGAMAERGRQAAYELRATCSDLYPSELEHLGLAAALESLAEATSLHEDVEVQFRRSSFPVDRRLPEAVEDAIYRAAREALDNVCRHAGARHALMELGLEPGAVILSIEDDGQGFNVPISSATLLRSGHFGLAGMRERAERLGGSLEVLSSRGSGLRLCMRIPYESALMSGAPVASLWEARSA
jgi:signal transduction histidine kinase